MELVGCGFQLLSLLRGRGQNFSGAVIDVEEVLCVDDEFFAGEDDFRIEGGWLRRVVDSDESWGCIEFDAIAC